MKNIYILLLSIIINTGYAQQGLIQEIQLSKKDSVQLVNLPEMKMSFNYSQNHTPLPSSVDNSTQPYWRGIFWQAGCSCGQASSEGYVYTYEINRKRNLDATLDENRYPYSFTYNFLNIGNSVCGASFLESQDIIREAGIPNLPTNGGVMTDGPMKKWLSGYDKYYAAMQNRSNGVYAIHVGTPEGLNVLKHWLNDHLENSSVGGLAFFYANHVHDPEIIPTGTPEEGKHIITAFSNTSHAMTIVGYNDEVRYDYNNDGQYTNDIDITGDGIVDMRDWEIGAFKIANSYNGSESPIVWADQGFSYVMYRILPYHNSQGGIWDKTVYVTDVKETYSPLLTAKVNLTYDSRNKIKVMAGVSTNLSATFPDYIKEYPMFRFHGDDLYMQGGTDASDKTIEFGLDLSELLNYVDSNQAAKYFLYIKEDDPSNVGTGQVNSFSIIDYTNAAHETISTQTNVPINNNGNTILSAETTCKQSDVRITTDTIPIAELNNIYSAQIEASGGQDPYKWFPFFDYKITTIANTFTPITGTSVSGSYTNVNLDFQFPFYGKEYNVGTVSSYGALMFENEDMNVPYDRDYSVLYRYFKAIEPFYGGPSSSTIKYEGDATYAKFYWTANFDGIDMQYMITLFPDGTIYIDYGNGTTPTDPEWSAGIGKGDQISYQKFDFSGNNFPTNTRVILEPRPFPTGLSIDNNGLISGTMTEEFLGDSIFVKVIDNNWLTDVKGFLFTNRGLLFSNYQFTTPNNNTLEYGETAQMSLDLSNVGESSVNNIELELIDNDPYFSITDNTESLATLNLGETHTLTNAFEIEVNNQVPDNTLLTFIVHVTSDEVSAADTVSFVARAPKIEVTNTVFIDGVDNIMDPGDTGDLLIYYKNTGGSDATTLVSSYSPTDAYITINSVTGNTKAILQPDSTWIVTLNITSNANTPAGYFSTIDSDINADKSFHSNNDITIGIGLIIENWETGTTDQFPWGFTGDANWFIDNTTVHEGNYAIRSGNISDNQITTLSLIGAVATSGSISFYRKVSSENNYDYLRFYLDSVQVGEWCGEVNWSEVTFPVSAGLHSFEWKYEKDQSVSNGSDATWVDYITLPPLDFSAPEMQVSVSSIDKTMAPDQMDTDTIFVSNIGGGILTYSVSIDDATISTPPPTSGEIENHSIEGSTINSVPNTINTGTPISLELTVHNSSSDSEYLKDITISFPLGVQLDSASNFVGGSGGAMEWDTNHGNGNDVNWHGENTSNGYGFIYGNESATATLYLTINPSISNSIVLQYQLDGDIYGGDPHTITDFLVLTNDGANDTWLTLGEDSGNLAAGQNGNLLLNYNTFGIPEGTYNCNVSVISSTDSIGIPVTLHVIDGLKINEIKNGISIFPNPASTYFTIENPNNNTSIIEIFDATGKIVHKETISSKYKTIETNKWAKGLYLIVLHQNNSIYSQQIIIE